MPTAVYTVTASCSAEDAFDYVADVARHPEWASDEMRVELLTPGVTGVGARYRTIGHSEVWHTDNVAEVEVTRHERPAAYEIVPELAQQPSRRAHKIRQLRVRDRPARVAQSGV